MRLRAAGGQRAAALPARGGRQSWAGLTAAWPRRIASSAGLRGRWIARRRQQIVIFHEGSIDEADAHRALGVVAARDFRGGVRGGEQSGLAGFKIPAAGCTKVLGSVSARDVLFLGSGTVTLEALEPGQSGDVTFDCPVTASRGTLTGIRVYYSDSDGPGLGNLGYVRVSLVRTVIEKPIGQPPRFRAAEVCVMDTDLNFDVSPKSGPTTTSDPLRRHRPAGSVLLPAGPPFAHDGGVMSFMGAEFP